MFSGNAGPAIAGISIFSFGLLSSIISLITGSGISLITSLLSFVGSSLLETFSAGSCVASSPSLGITTLVTLLGMSIKGSLFLAANCSSVSFGLDLILKDPCVFSLMI